MYLHSIWAHKPLCVCVNVFDCSLIWLLGRKLYFAKSWLEMWEWRPGPKHLPWVWLCVGLCLFGACAWAALRHPAQARCQALQDHTGNGRKSSVLNVPTVVKHSQTTFFPSSCGFLIFHCRHFPFHSSFLTPCPKLITATIYVVYSTFWPIASLLLSCYSTKYFCCLVHKMIQIYLVIMLKMLYKVVAWLFGN